MNTLDDIKMIDLPKIADERGNLSIIENIRNVPFVMKRVHWIYDVPGGIDRGGHAFRENEEFIVALSGSFDVILDDGKERKVVPLKRSYYGLYVPSGIWRVMNDFSTNALALVLSSKEYSDADYILDYQEFKKWRAAQ